MHPRTTELLDYLDQQRGVLRAAFNAVPEAHRALPPAPEKWSAVGVIEHLALTETRIAARLTAQIAEARTTGVAQETDASPVLPTLDLTPAVDRSTRRVAASAIEPTGLDEKTAWATLDEATEAVRAALTDADGLALGTITAPHPRFGAISVYYWFAFIGAHEARHADQIREIAAALAARPAV